MTIKVPVEGCAHAAGEPVALLPSQPPYKCQMTCKETL